MSNQRIRIPSLDDHYCQVCSTPSTTNNEKRLSCFSCDHCRMSMCYECFERHTNSLIEEYNQIQTHFNQLIIQVENKRQFLATFQEHCLRNVNATFDEILNDLQNLRRESLAYVQQQFNDTEIIMDDIVTHIQPMMIKSQQYWTQEGISKNAMIEFEIQRKQIAELEQRLNIFASPHLKIQMSTYPRSKLDLHCQLLNNSYLPSKRFSYFYPGKSITTRCSYRKGTETQNEKIDVDTEVEELQSNPFVHRAIQTEPPRHDDSDDENDVENDNDVDNATGRISDRLNRENYLSSRSIEQRTILTQNEVDRITNDGENLFYYSETAKSICYITKIFSNKQGAGVFVTEEITCRWPHNPILDLIYSPGSGKFLCATKTGVYSCTIQKSTIDIHLELTQICSYVRLAADKNSIWLWTDTPRANLLRTYSAKTFTCIKIYNLNDYPRFTDNSTSFSVHNQTLATLFQFKQTTNSTNYRKMFHLTLCDTSNLQEICTIRLGACEIDHEIRVNSTGLFFITNGKRKLWFVDENGRKEFVKLTATGRALTIDRSNRVIIANGTQQLQLVEFSTDENGFH